MSDMSMCVIAAVIGLILGAAIVGALWLRRALAQPRAAELQEIADPEARFYARSRAGDQDRQEPRE